MNGMLDCHAVMRQLWAFLDGELTTDRIAAIEEHIAKCARCYPQYHFERTFLEQIGRVRREHSDMSGLRTRLMHALSVKGFGAP